jgi:hypothetical protein
MSSTCRKTSEINTERNAASSRRANAIISRGIRRSQNAEWQWRHRGTENVIEAERRRSQVDGEW